MAPSVRSYSPVFGEKDPHFDKVTLLLPLMDNDAANYGRTGGTMTVGSGGSTGFSTAQGKFGFGSYYVDGASGFGTVAPNAAAYGIVSQSFTIELWVYPISHGAFGGFISQAGNSWADGWQFLFNSTSYNPWLTLATSGGSNIGQYASNTVITDGAWHHLAITRNAANLLNMWVNGVSTFSTTVTNTNVFLSDAYNSPLKIGASRESARVQQHYINDVRITQGVCRYTGSFTPPTERFPRQ